MDRDFARVRGLGAGLASFLKQLVISRRGAVSPMMALALIPVIGALAMAGEAGNWYLMKRDMQNAADAAAVAAATNNDAVISGTSYISEARAVTAGYGFTNNGTDPYVQVQANQTCPSPSTDTDCYKVTITKKVPIYMLGIVGVSGDTTKSSGARAQTVVAAAMARPKGQPRGYCMDALGTSGNPLTINGGPQLNLNGCDLFSNASMKCNGLNSDTGVIFGDAVGTSNCGQYPRGSQTAITDPFSALASSVPSNTCSSYPQIPTHKNDPALPSSNQLSGIQGWGAQTVVRFCGDVQLTGDTTITTASPGTVLLIENGQLNLNGFKLSAAAGSGLTLMFSGTTASGYTHYPTGSGTLDFGNPTSGTWKGVAIYQDPILTSGIDFTYGGNSPTVNITGLLYASKANITIAGAINHQTGGFACFGIIANTITVSGTAALFQDPTSECYRDGLILPGVPGSEKRQALVQ